MRRCSAAPALALTATGLKGRRTALGEHDAVHSGAVGHAQQSAEVLRVFDAVESEQQAGAPGLRRSGSKRSSMERNSCGRTKATTPWWAGVWASCVNCSRASWRTRTPASRQRATRLLQARHRGARGPPEPGRSAAVRP